MRISVKSNIKEVRRDYSRLERTQLPFATSLALNRTAWHIAGFRGKKGALSRTVRRYIDRPRRVDLFYAVKSNKRNLTAEVNFKDSGSKVFPADYYTPLVFGGKRQHKKHERSLQRMGILSKDEYTVPGRRMKLNRFGNITGATYSKILADVNRTSRAGGDDIQQGFGQRTTRRGKKQYFYEPNIRPRAIWKRQGKKAFPALLFVKAPTYRKTFPMRQLVDRFVQKRFDREFSKAMSQALRTNRR